MTPTTTAALAASLLLPTPFVVLAPANATPKRSAQERTQAALPTSSPTTAPAAATTFSAPLANAHPATNNAAPSSTAPTRPLLATNPHALSPVSPSPSSAPPALSCVKTSSTAHHAKATANATTASAPAPPPSAASRPGLTSTSPSSSVSPPASARYSSFASSAAAALAASAAAANRAIAQPIRPTPAGSRSMATALLSNNTKLRRSIISGSRRAMATLRRTQARHKEYRALDTLRYPAARSDFFVHMTVYDTRSFFGGWDGLIAFARYGCAGFFLHEGYCSCISFEFWLLR